MRDVLRLPEQVSRAPKSRATKGEPGVPLSQEHSALRQVFKNSVGAPALRPTDNSVSPRPRTAKVRDPRCQLRVAHLDELPEAEGPPRLRAVDDKDDPGVSEFSKQVGGRQRVRTC